MAGSAPLSSALDGGFTEPVLDAQGAFHAVMNALAEPGTVQPVGPATQPPMPLSPVAGAIALALCDADTPVWLDAGLAAEPAVTGWLSFHAGAPMVREPVAAAFAFIAEPAAMPPLAAFAQGSLEYPDRSATLVLQVAEFEGGETLVLEGPGIETQRRVAPRPLPADFTAQRVANRALFPRGVDIVLAGPGGVMALPRSTRIVSGD